MSVLPVGFGSSGSVDTGDITKSLRFRSSGSTHLSRTFGTSTNDIKWAFSFWIKNGTLGVTNPIFSAGDGTASNYFSLERTSGNLLRVVVVYGGVTTLDCSTTAVFRDPTGHTQFLLYFDSANATSTDRLQLWQAGDGSNQSGKRLTLTYTTGPIGINEPSIASWSAVVHYIGRLRYTATYGDMYLSRICFFDNSLPAMTAIGYYNTEINEWVPKTRSEVKSVVDAAGASSFMLEFEDGTSLTTLGNDYSAKNNDWTLTNHSLTAGVTYDWMEDRPGNSYAVLNPIKVASGISAVTYSEGNLRGASTSNAVGRSQGSVDVTSGKWYAEFNLSNCSGGTTNWVGVSSDATSRLYYFDGTYWNGSSSGAYGATYTNGDVIGIALDMDSQTLEFFKNGTSQGQKTSIGLSGSEIRFRADTFISGGISFVYANFGQRPFTYTPPTGFLALCQANLTSEVVTVSGSFTGNLAADGPFVWLNGVPKTLTINGNAVTFGTHADKTAGGFKLRTASSSYNNTGSNTYTATIDSNRQNCFKYRNAQGN